MLAVERPLFKMMTVRFGHLRDMIWFLTDGRYTSESGHTKNIFSE